MATEKIAQHILSYLSAKFFLLHHSLGLFSLLVAISVCPLVCLWQSRTPTSWCPGDFWSKGVSPHPPSRCPAQIHSDIKIDGACLVDNRPSTDYLQHFVKKNVTCDMWHVTCDMRDVTYDMWHMTCNTWHKTCNTWHMTHGGGCTFSQNFISLLSSYGLGVASDVLKIRRKRINQSLNHKGVCRKATATLGLFIMG